MLNLQSLATDLKAIHRANGRISACDSIVGNKTCMRQWRDIKSGIVQIILSDILIETAGNINQL